MIIYRYLDYNDPFFQNFRKFPVLLFNQIKSSHLVGKIIILHQITINFLINSF